ncbi:hypothetical protein GWG65_39290 [Bradyrhizobium sp. CSA207]|uniref:hypothetical protein n=1 Tax=Bradyrhizobium sp. CSA207 TaxID=2698826 RepID=UPI0023AFDB6E|nr:hypothetical protein [Bradyrhizobium sp. CSA207]MDE5447250.1 hypothetical protein [Bradyrhizobium sp. CSA207]
MLLLSPRSVVCNLSAPRVIKNHDVDTLLALDKYRTIQDGSYDFCICLRLDLQRWCHLRLCAAQLAAATKDDKRA